MKPGKAGYQIKIQGIVQGVGFRPFVYRLAQELELNGWVLNSSAGVTVVIEGEEYQLQEFARRVVAEAPPLAVIRNCEVHQTEVEGFQDFSIRASNAEEDTLVMVSPDIAICSDCRQEVRDPGDRRYGYPFTNCTNCGPRFTIIKDLPYDRDKTTMAVFPMCDECRDEYENPLHRRFHAQPNACPVCGPHTTLVDRQGNPVQTSPAELLRQGYIIAVKGLGAFHLAVDATQSKAVKTLRTRKKRDAKPFAVMARDFEIAEKYCVINPVEKKWLTSPQAPIVIMKTKESAGLSIELHPGLDTLGVMLPYTPLHYLLFDDELELLVMTSANISDEPLIIDNQEAMAKLNDVADYFLIHNRDIFNPCDDSVMTVTPLAMPQWIRRARGMVPMGITLPRMSRPVLAVGGEMKNTFCITRQGEAFLSQHWGDLNHYGNYIKFQQGIERFKRMLDVEPEIIAHDLHPDYQATRWARQQTKLPLVPVQHHHAHLAAAMAENGLEEEVLGLICDGTGWGSDGAVWGGEILRGDYRQFDRLGHLKYVPLPGGDLTARKPYRMALVYLLEALGEGGVGLAEKSLPALGSEERNLLVDRWRQGKHEIKTSSCGRIFDAVAAILGICDINNYEGQAAMELETAAGPGTYEPYGYQLEKSEAGWEMNVLPMWPDIIRDLSKGISREVISAQFHWTMVKMFADMLDKVRGESRINKVVLSGGVFHNQIILLELTRQLSKQGFEVFQHQLVPPGDGGIALGQAIIASEVKAGCV